MSVPIPSRGRGRAGGVERTKRNEVFVVFKIDFCFRKFTQLARLQGTKPTKSHSTCRVNRVIGHWANRCQGSAIDSPDHRPWTRLATEIPLKAMDTTTETTNPQAGRDVDLFNLPAADPPSTPSASHHSLRATHRVGRRARSSAC
jgi:hypothetical protein